MAQDLYQYEKMIERALRGVVREALERASREGLRGAHHFYIGFATDMAGVSIPDSLRARYPQEMTIVLQHQFWDLDVEKDGFSVTLSFQKQLERLVIPFAAVRSFADPSVNFSLEFATPETPAAMPAAVPAPIARAADPADGQGEKSAKKAEEKTTAEVVALDSFRKR
jgi:hypothetical protein